MVAHINRSGSHFVPLITVIGLILIGFSADAQVFKKKNREKKADKRSEYAYQTFSTTLPKQRKKSFTGEAKFHFDKPLFPVSFGTIDRAVDYSKAPYFGHKHPPKKHAPGDMKLCKVCGIKH